jgi:hypothetical protein
MGKLQEHAIRLLALLGEPQTADHDVLVAASSACCHLWGGSEFLKFLLGSHPYCKCGTVLCSALSSTS